MQYPTRRKRELRRGLPRRAGRIRGVMRHVDFGDDDAEVAFEILFVLADCGLHGAVFFPVCY